MVILYFFILTYNVFLVTIIYLLSVRSPHVEKSEEDIMISVVIPVKDDPHLPSLIKDLQAQTIGKKFFEVIVVNDHSKVAINVDHEFATLLSLPDEEKGKKAALTYGIGASKGNVIVTIDSDCNIEPQFLEEIYTTYYRYDVILSPGFVRYESSDFFGKLQSLENAAVMGTSLALHNGGYTSLSNGANLSFRKELWEELNGYESHQSVPSGDDELLVQQAVEKYPGRIIWRTTKSSIVSTLSNDSINKLYHQRLRWASKWRYYSSNTMKFVAIFTVLWHLALFTGIVLLFFQWDLLLALALGLKFLLEFALIIIMSLYLHQRFNLFGFLLLQVLYSPYVIFFGVLSNFLPFQWKGRKYSH